MKKLITIALAALLLTGCAAGPSEAEKKDAVFSACVEQETAYVAKNFSAKQIRANQADVEFAIYELCTGVSEGKTRDEMYKARNKEADK